MAPGDEARLQGYVMALFAAAWGGAPDAVVECMVRRAEEVFGVERVHGCVRRLSRSLGQRDRRLLQ